MLSSNTKAASIRPTLREYIESAILPLYEAFDPAHQYAHAKAVIEASLKYAAMLHADSEMAYTIAAYHDIGLSEGREHHHTVSARMMLADRRLREWFDEAQLGIMAEAVEDHRASNRHEPRSVYGRIVAEADRQIEPLTIIRRTIQYSLSHYPDYSEQQHYERVCEHLHEKYGEGGYLKLWIPQSDNAGKLDELRRWMKDDDMLHRTFAHLYQECMNESNKAFSTLKQAPDIQISLVGTGRVAKHLAIAFRKAGYKIPGIYSLNHEHAQTLASVVGNGCQALKNMADVSQQGIVIFCISDKALPQAIAQYQEQHPDSEALLLHTAGSVDINVFCQSTSKACDKYGVMYPLQTFSDGREIDLSKVPIFIEGNNEATLKAIEHLAGNIFGSVSKMDSAHRRFLHLAGVFANNFTNHCYSVAAELIEKSGADFSALLPMIDETAAKVHTLPPREAQTGPAVRQDVGVMQKHQEMLQDKALFHDRATILSELYEVMSQSIMQQQSSKEV